MKRKIGLVVNPIAGMGGKVGLKGTDGSEVLEKARELGAEPVAPERAVKALSELAESDVDLEILTFSDEMGAQEAERAGFSPKVLSEIDSGNTRPEDTTNASRRFREENAEIILFAGGDGTARDVMEGVDTKIPVLGIPTGVKMHSAVFANTPEIAGRLVYRFLESGLPVREAEIMDVDEDAFRSNELDTDLKGYCLTPYDPRWVQSAKSPTSSSGSEKKDQEAIARWVAENMENDKIYILGPGTTTRTVAEELGISDFTLLGVDLLKAGGLIAEDVREAEILDYVRDEDAEIVVSPIGKQGFIFGRGNQQISPEVLRKVGKDNVMVIATPNKLITTEMLKIDTGDEELNEEFRGYNRVVMGYGENRPVPVA